MHLLLVAEVELVWEWQKDCWKLAAQLYFIAVGESAVAQAQRLSGMGYAAKVVTGDLTEESWVKQIFTQALEKLDGRIDILVNCAGAQYRAPAMDFPLEKFDEVMNVNNRSVFILSKLLLRICFYAGTGKSSISHPCKAFLESPIRLLMQQAKVRWLN